LDRKFFLWIELDDAPMKRNGDRLGPVGDPQLPQDAAHMELDRALGDVQRRSDLPVAPPPHEEPEDVQLPDGELGPGKPFRQPGGDLRWNVPLSGDGLAD